MQKIADSRRCLLAGSAALVTLVCCAYGGFTVEKLETKPHPTYPTQREFSHEEEAVRACVRQIPTYQTDEASRVYFGDGRRLRHRVQLALDVQALAPGRTQVHVRVTESRVLTHSGGQRPCLGHPMPAGSSEWTPVPPTTAQEHLALLRLERCLEQQHETPSAGHPLLAPPAHVGGGPS